MSAIEKIPSTFRRLSIGVGSVGQNPEHFPLSAAAAAAATTSSSHRKGCD